MSNTTAIAKQTKSCNVFQAVPAVLSIDKIENAIDVFLSFQDVNHHTPDTYKKALKQFFGWVRSTDRVLSALTRADIIQFKQDMRAANYAPNTINSYLTAVRRFYTFCDLYDIAPNIAKGIKSEKTTNEEQHEKLDFTAHQAGDIIAAAQGNKRDTAILSLLLRCALRTVEVVRANIGDIVLMGETHVLTVHGKGDKIRRVALTEKTWAVVNDYLMAERKGAKDDEPLFASQAHQCQGGRMATASVSRMAKKCIRAVGINDSKHTAHSCRHTAASLIYDKTRDLDRIQQLLGHDDPATTQIYAKKSMRRDYLKHAPNAVLDTLF